MKKLLAIIILGLLLSGCASTFDVLNSGDIKVGISKQSLKYAYRNTGVSNDPILASDCYREYFSESKMEIIASADKDVWFVFENVKWPSTQCGASFMGDGSLYGWEPTYAQAKEHIKEKKTAAKTEPKKTTPESTTTKDDEKLLEIASGTGFIVTGDGYFISNNHVVEICKELKTKKAGKVYPVVIIATDKVNDLAIGKIDLSNSKYIFLSSEGGVLGEEIIVSGYPLQGELSESVKITKGVISSLSGPGNNYAIMQIDAAVQPGNSGGPILNQYAEMVGVIVAKADTLYFLEKAGALPENINFGIKVETVQSFVKGNNIQLSKSSSLKSKSLSSAEISKVAADSTIHLQCWNTLAAAAKLARGSKARNFIVDVD